MFWHLAAAFVTLTLAIGTVCAQDDGLVAAWDFDEGEGTIARDVTGGGSDARISGAKWVKHADGFALRFDGQDDFADCGAPDALDLRETVSIETWVKPESIPSGEPIMLGKSIDSFGLTMYKDSAIWWYISAGTNQLRFPVEINQWHHVVGTYDGKLMRLYIDRRMVAQRESTIREVSAADRFLMGASSPGGAGPYWCGLMDRVRVYDRALSAEEVTDHYAKTAGDYDVDTTWFGRIRLSTNVDRRKNQLVGVADTRGLFNAPGAGMVLTLHHGNANQPGATQRFEKLPEKGLLPFIFDLTGLQDGTYTVAARLIHETVTATQVSYLKLPLAPAALPSPVEHTIPPPAPRPGAAEFTIEVNEGGGLTIEANGRKLAIESSYSYPNAGENRLVAGAPNTDGEDAWQVTTRTLADDLFEVSAGGSHYSITRQIKVLPNRLKIEDTVTNETTEDLGVIIDNHLNAADDPFDSWFLAGYPNAAMRPEQDSPSTFAAWDGDGGLGLGMLPLDDVTVVHSKLYCRDGRIGIMDDRFGLAPGASHTVEWSVYPCEAPDYFSFINQARRDENRRGHIPGGFAFVPREGMTADHAEIRGIEFGSFGCLTKVADDPEIEIEGIEFIELPRERARIRSEFNAIRKVKPNLKLMFHVAHSLWSTNRPTEVFPDSRVIDADGTHFVYPYNYGNGAYFSDARHEAGWRWYIYYPMPGNSFHDALMRSVDVMIDDIGCNGAFMDGFFTGYASRYTWDRWDGHTVEIDPETRTIRDKMGSVLLLSQPSLVEYAWKMHERGATVIANNLVMTRTMASLPLITDQEIRSGPDMHLAHTPVSLGDPSSSDCEAGVYGDVLEKLRWGNLYFYYNEGDLTYPSLPQQMYPITIEEIESGIVRGPERIVTMRPGIYGWPGSRELHFCYRYNSVGMPIDPDFVTTVVPDAGRGEDTTVRTHVDLEQSQSAVVKGIPVELTAAQPVNVTVRRYDADQVTLVLAGSGPASLALSDGDFPVVPNASYEVNGRRTKADAEGVLTIPVTLVGQAEISISAAGK